MGGWGETGGRVDEWAGSWMDHGWIMDGRMADGWMDG